jgi:aminobenzoyl-glutamate transport protein
MTQSPALTGSSSWFLERIGNLLPSPSTLFALRAAAVVILSWAFAGMGVLAIHPASGQVVPVISLLIVEGLHRMRLNLVPDFVAFPPLGTVLACLVGIAVAKRAGLTVAPTS